MGLTLEFLTGDSRRLIEAVQNFDLDALYKPPACLHQTDFSLHLVPQDLDSMSKSLGLVAGIDPLPLRPFLTVVVDSEDGGALEIADEWIRYVAKCDAGLAEEVSCKWVDLMRLEHPGEEIELTNEMTEAVRSLIRLCFWACSENQRVIHVWFP